MITISKSENTKTAAAKIAAVLKNPGTVALVPTETVYGLVCRASDRVAIDRIVHLKHRSAGKFLGWFVRDCTVAEQYGLRFSDTAKRLE